MNMSMNEIVNADNNKMEWANISKWYRAATVRNSPRIMVPLEDEEGQFIYPKSRQNIVSHDLVVNRGDETISYILAQSAYRYMFEIGLLETKFVIDCSLKIVNNEIYESKGSEKLEALAVVIDEGYHAYVALDFVMQMKQKTGWDPVEIPSINGNLKAVNDVLDTIPEAFKNDFYLISCTIAEHTLTKDLLSVGREKDATESFTKVMKDHVSDEGRHAGYFARMMKMHWSNMREDSKRYIGSMLPDYLDEYLAYDKNREFEEKVLNSCGFTKAEVEKILQDTKAEYIEKNESYIDATKANIVQLLKRSKFFECANTEHSFKKSGLLT